MAAIELRNLKSTERLPGWHGRYFHTEHMPFAHIAWRGPEPGYRSRL